LTLHFSFNKSSKTKTTKTTNENRDNLGSETERSPIRITLKEK